MVHEWSLAEIGAVVFKKTGGTFTFSHCRGVEVSLSVAGGSPAEALGGVSTLLPRPLYFPSRGGWPRFPTSPSLVELTTGARHEGRG